MGLMIGRKIFNQENSKNICKSRKIGYQDRLKINHFGPRKSKENLQDVVESGRLL